MVDPVLKWAGGKRSLVAKIVGLFPVDYPDRAYHEPFLGGGAVFFRVGPRAGTINDVNGRLVNFYQVVRDTPDALIAAARGFACDEASFYRLRDRFNSPGLSVVEDAALLLYLNKTAFNGLYRVNARGEFNVPFGRYKNPVVVNERRIREASRVLQRVELVNRDFGYVEARAEPGDLCYFDPPYQPVSATANFTAYSETGFGFAEQHRLRDLCVRLQRKRVWFVLSNSSAPELVELYTGIPGVRIEQAAAKRVISSKASTRGTVAEILVTNVPVEDSVAAHSSLDAFLED